jgi:hypothetical protein
MKTTPVTLDSTMGDIFDNMKISPKPINSIREIQKLNYTSEFLSIDWRLIKRYPKVLNTLYIKTAEGFNCDISKVKQPLRFTLWKMFSQAGFTDNTSFCKEWRKPFHRKNDFPPRVRDYDWCKGDDVSKWCPLGAYYQMFGTSSNYWKSLNKYKVIRDLGIETIIEPMCSTGEFAYHAQLYKPMNTLCIDTNRRALEYISSYVAAPRKGFTSSLSLRSVLEDTWSTPNSTLPRLNTLSYIGKQSLNIFKPLNAIKFLDIALFYSEYVWLEMMQYDFNPMFKTSNFSLDITPTHLKNLGVKSFFKQGKDLSNFARGATSIEAYLEDSKGNRLNYVECVPWNLYTPSSIIAMCLSSGVDINLDKSFIFHEGKKYPLDSVYLPHIDSSVINLVLSR